MQYEVPQFETEANILGPFNLVQFIIASGVGISLLFLWNILEMWLWLLVTIIFGGSTIAFLFGRVRGRKMTTFFPMALNYLWQPKKYIYKKPETVVVGLKNISVPAAVKPIEIKPERIKTRVATPETISPYALTERQPLPAEKKVIITPKVTQIEPKQETSLLRDLMNKITTTTAPIPQRETSIKRAEITQKEGEYEVLENIMGEKEIAKRVDYRI